MSETPHNQEHEKQLDPRVESLAVPLARDYAEKNYAKREDGTFEPAWRGANGEKDLRGKSPDDIASELVADGWTNEAAEAQAQTMVVDIANTPYDQFSEHWKEQNRGGAEYLISLLDERDTDTIRGLDLSKPDVRSEYGTLIHDNWISRNEWVKHPEYGNPDLAKPFEELSDEEKQKDIDQLGVLQGWLNNQILDKFGYSEEEKVERAHVRARLKELEDELVIENPEEYSIHHPGNNGYDAKHTVMDRSAEALRRVEDELGLTVNRARQYGYNEIMAGRPQAWYASRFGDR